MPSSDLSNEEIIENLKNSFTGGNEITPEFERNFEIIVGRYHKKAYNLCRYYGLSHNDASDAVQSGLFDFYRFLRTFKSGKKFEPWFIKIILNQMRKKYNELKKHAFSDIFDIADCKEDSEKNISEEFQEREQIRYIINSLPEKYRSIVILKIYNDMSFEEIANVENISSRQVRNRFDDACLRMRACLEKDEAQSA